jgi:hypothetical protein
VVEGNWRKHVFGPASALISGRSAVSPYPGVHPGTPRGVRRRPLSQLTNSRITMNNQEQSLDNHLRATEGVHGTVRAMTTKKPTYAPTGYLQHFSTEEFRFRWLEALAEVREAWRHSGVDHLARALCDHMNIQGSCHPSLATLAREMAVSEGMVRDNYKILVAEGWLIVVPRHQETNIFQAVLPAYGLELLNQKREAAANRNSVGEWREAADKFLSAMCAGLGIDREGAEATPAWARVEGKVYKLLARLGGPESDVSYVVKRVIEEPPGEIHSPVGLLMARLTKAERSLPKASRSTRNAKARVKSDEVEKVLASTMEQLTSWRQNEGPATNDRSLERVDVHHEARSMRPHG